jgi:uncharacterized protein (TIGR03437 family)
MRRPCCFIYLALLYTLICDNIVGADPQPIALRTLALPQFVPDVVWDSSRSRFFASSGTGVLIVNPDTAQVEDTIPIGDIAQRIAVSDDGQHLYAAIGSRGVIRRYQVQNHSFELEISLGRDNQNRFLMPAAMVVLPGQPLSILIAPGYWPAVDPYPFPSASTEVVVFDGAVKRPGTIPLVVSSLYIRPSDGAIFGWGGGQISSLTVNAKGVTLARSVPVMFSQDTLPVWRGNLVTNLGGSVFDLNTGSTLGQLTTGSLPGSCALAPDASGTSIFAVSVVDLAAQLIQYSTASFRPTANANLSGNRDDFDGACAFTSVIKTWGADGLLINEDQNAHSHLVFLHAVGLDGIAPPSFPTPVQDSSGVIRLPIPANDLVYDAGRNLIWASIPGKVGQVGNDVISIDPATGNILDAIGAGSEPGRLALTGDGSRLFTALNGAPMITPINLGTKQAEPPFTVIDTASTNSLPWKPVGLAAIPNESKSIIVVRNASTQSFDRTSVVVYDSGVLRQRTFDSLFDQGMPYTNFVQAIFPGDSFNSFYAADESLQYGDGRHEVFRLTVDSTGISLDRQLNSILLGNANGNTQFGSMTYTDGRLFTSAGQIYTPDTAQLLGSVATDGIPVPFSDHNRISYVQASAVMRPSAVTVFDLTTFRPLATFPLDLPQSAPMVTAAVRVGASTIALATGSQIMLVPLSSLQMWPSYSGQVQEVAPGVQGVDIPVSAIAALPGSSKLLLATPSRAGSIGNSIVTFNPVTNQIENTSFIGSEPSILAPAADGSAVYASLSGELRIGRLNIAGGSRDLSFAADPAGNSNQYDVYNMALGPDGGLAVTYFGGETAVFDSGVPRPHADLNDQGAYAFTPATFELAFNDTGSMLYAYNSFFSTSDMKRSAVSPSGVQFLSSIGALIVGYNTKIKYAQGLLYASNGTVVDPERSRVVGRFENPNIVGVFGQQVAPDPAAGRVYFVNTGGIFVFDIHTYAMLGSLPLNLSYTAYPLNLVRFGTDGLALNTSAGGVLLVSIAAIPLLPAPVPSPQSSLPSTPGVTVVDLAAQDIAYDSSRDLIYASVPNSEAALGDHIASINPGTGAMTASYPAGLNPRLLAISGDSSQLFYTSGRVSNQFVNGFSFTSESVQNVDIASGTISPNFALQAGPNASRGILDMAVLPEQARSIAVIEDLGENVQIQDTTVFENLGPESLRVYDSGTQRMGFLGSGGFNCSSIQAGSTASRLYCASTNNFSRLAADNHGISVLDSTTLKPGNGSWTQILFSAGRIYTATGLVIDAETKTVIATLQAQGPVAVDGNRIYWLDPSGSESAHPSVVLRSFDGSTLQPIETRQINVTSSDVTRLVACGQGRLAFRAGREIYIVLPTAPLSSKNSASFASGLPLAPNMIAFVETAAIAPALLVSSDNPWPATLGGVRLDIIDSQGQTRAAPIYFVTINSMSFLVPAATALGHATAKLTTSTGVTISSAFDVDVVSPGLYTANASGSGVPAGFWIRKTATGVQTQNYLFDPAQPVGSRVPVSVDLGTATDQVFLSLYGTGFRNAAGASATVGGVSVPVSALAAVPIYQGEDIVNIGPLPHSLAGRGQVDVVVAFSDKTANTVTISIR